LSGALVLGTTTIATAENRTAGYVLNGDVLKNQQWVSPSVNSTADGSLYFTVEDLAKWDEKLEAGRAQALDTSQSKSPVRMPLVFSQDCDTMRLVVPGATLVALGFHMVFSSFFVSTLGIREK